MNSTPHFPPLPAHRIKGFTLVEVSLVLIIIGFLAGAILVGKDLYRAYLIRATIKQYDQYNSAVQAFLLKFNCLPGDCVDVVTLGFEPQTEGNGDGLVGETSLNEKDPCSSYTVQTCYKETYHFWRQLSTANLIKEKIPLLLSSPPQYPFHGNTAMWLGQFSPPTVLPFNGSPPPLAIPPRGKPAAGWGIQGDILLDTSMGGGRLHAHGFFLTTLLPKGGTGTTAWLTIDGIGGPIPTYTHSIDFKIDNGLPLSGSVRAYTDFTTHTTAGQSGKRFGNHSGPGGANNAFCVRNDTTPPTYNIPYDGNNPLGLCNLIILGGF